MKEKHPIEPMLDEIANILRIFEENKNKSVDGDATPEEMVALANLEMQVRAASEAYFIALQREGLSDEEVVGFMQARDHMQPKDKAVLERLTKMGREVHAIYRALERALKKSRLRQAKTGRAFKGKKKSKKSLGIGFRKGWKRL